VGRERKGLIPKLCLDCVVFHNGLRERKGGETSPKTLGCHQILMSQGFSFLYSAAVASWGLAVPTGTAPQGYPIPRDGVNSPESLPFKCKATKAQTPPPTTLFLHSHKSGHYKWALIASGPGARELGTSLPHPRKVFSVTNLKPSPKNHSKCSAHHSSLLHCLLTNSSTSICAPLWGPSS
jgi:hypothetical protein